MQPVHASRLPPDADRFFIRHFFAFCEDLLHCVMTKVPPAGASPPWLRPQVRDSPDKLEWVTEHPLN
jgi:hypothetical protein